MHLLALSSMQLPSECVDRITKPILTTDSTSDSEDSAIESDVESTTVLVLNTHIVVKTSDSLSFNCR